MIMPLANARDKYTQILWGIEDFRFRFGREPEGMWLPETAVDLESLDIMAELGIKYTILAPHQAHLFRKIGDSQLDRCQRRPHRSHTRIHCSTALRAEHRDLFLRRADISRCRIRRAAQQRRGVRKPSSEAYSDGRDWPQLAHIATDGESYGHHHRYGEMALSYALHHIEENGLAKLTNYGEYLDAASAGA